MLTITSQYTRAYQVLERFKKYVVQQSKSNLTKGGHNASSSLYGSIKGYINKRQSRNLAGKFTGGSSMPSLTFEMNSYGAFLDEGVKGSKSNYINNRNTPYKFGRNGDKKSVPVAPIRKWVQSKGLDAGSEYAIAKSIYQKGIEKTSFFSKPFDKRFGTTMNLYHGAIADDIANNIANQLARKLRQKNKLKK
tara:strand:- start:3279 stop:3854 length:576 start_codon:yes stop_codon:yes gene_type:complete